MNQTVAWVVMVSFTGLVLFVKDPDTERVTHALLLDGREGHNHAGSCDPGPDPDCKKVICDDFKHEAEVSWKVGLSRQVTKPLFGARVFFRWLDSDGVVLPMSAGAEPVPGTPAKSCPSLGDGRLFAWVPPLEGLTPLALVRKPFLKETRKLPEGLASQVILSAGPISTRTFSTAGGDRLIVKFPLAPRIHDKPARVIAAAESVSWEVERPEKAVKLEMVLEWPADGRTEVVVLTEVGSGTTEVELSNQPAPRCETRPHPGRSPGFGGIHFRMLYDALKGGTAFPNARKPLPWIPELDSSVCPQFDGWEDLGGMIHRPLCIPGSAYSVSDGK